MIYWFIGIVGILIYLPGSFYMNSTYLSIQPYILSAYFILSSLIYYFRTRSLDLKPYLFMLASYMAYFVLTLLVNSLFIKPNQFWFLEIFIQIALSGTFIFIGYGLAFIVNRLYTK